MSEPTSRLPESTSPVTADPATESAPEIAAAVKTPALDSGKSTRAVVGVVLELVGIIAVAFLVINIFQEQWTVVTEGQWILLGVSGLTLIGFVLCVSAMFQQRRELAVLGIWLGILGSIATATCGTILLATVLELWGPRPRSAMIASTESALVEVMDDIRRFVDETGAAPTQDESIEVLAGREDAWGMPFRYMRRGPSTFEVSSAGPDQTFDSTDDIIDSGY